MPKQVARKDMIVKLRFPGLSIPLYVATGPRACEALRSGEPRRVWWPTAAFHVVGKGLARAPKGKARETRLHQAINHRADQLGVHERYLPTEGVPF